MLRYELAGGHRTGRAPRRGVSAPNRTAECPSGNRQLVPQTSETESGGFRMVFRA